MQPSDANLTQPITRSSHTSDTPSAARVQIRRNPPLLLYAHRRLFHEVRRRPLLTLARQFLGSETLLQDSRHLLRLHPELRADLLGPHSFFVRLDEKDDLIERLCNLVGRSSRQTTGLPLLRSSGRAGVSCIPGERAHAVAAITLGILALLGFATTTLVFVGILSMGFALLLSSSSLGARAVGVLRHPA